MSYVNNALRAVMTTSLLFAFGAIAPSAQAQTETFTATAALKTAAGAQVTAPVTVVVTRQTTEAERTKVIDALKRGGRGPAVAALIKELPDAGYIEVGGQRTTIKYAYARPLGGGRLMTVVSPTPILHLGAGLPDAQPRTGFDLSLALLETKDGGAGTGELALAATIKATDTSTVEVQDYGSEVVRLTNVMKK